MFLDSKFLECVVSESIATFSRHSPCLSIISTMSRTTLAVLTN